MNKVFLITIFTIALLSFTSCYYDKEDLLYGNADCNTSLTKGPLFTQVESLITTKCSGGGCHMNGGRAGGYNFDNVCTIVSAWSQIQFSCVSNSRMPLGSPLNSSEKLIITNWIDAGHRYDN